MSLTTDEILQRSPFNLTSEDERKAFKTLATSLNITLDDFLHGKVYKKECIQNPNAYSDEDQETIFEELKNSYLRIFDGKTPSRNKKYVATAGAPGSGKSEFVEVMLVKDNHNSVYLDPDTQILKNMACYNKLKEDADLEQAYKTFRDASNYINNFLMIWAIYKGYNILHGATNTDKRVRDTIFKGLKENGYEISLHVLFANAKLRSEALNYRLDQKKFYQVTNTDAKGKVAPVFERLMDAYLPYADKVQTYYNTNAFWLDKTVEQVKADCRMFATFDRSLDAQQVFLSKNCEDIIETLCNDVDNEVTDSKIKQQATDLFKSWQPINEHQETVESTMLTYFNMRNAAAIAASVVVIATGIALKLRNDS